jgi:glycosyltransferase involved in cell wall biosynthesis
MWSDELAEANRVGRAEMQAVAAMPWERVWGDSSFNLAEIAPLLDPATPRGVLPPFHETGMLLAERPAAAPQKPARILAVGRVVQSKGHPFLLRVMRYLVHDLGVPAVLDIVGKPDHRLIAYLRNLELIVREYALEPYVAFHGEIGNRTLAERYASASVFVSGSEHEGFCVPLVEAMAFGVPIVALGTTAVPETVGDAGLVWQERDPRRFALSIAELLRDAGQREALIQAGKRRYAEHFEPGGIATRFAAALGAAVTETA